MFIKMYYILLNKQEHLSRIYEVISVKIYRLPLLYLKTEYVVCIVRKGNIFFFIFFNYEFFNFLTYFHPTILSYFHYYENHYLYTNYSITNNLSLILSDYCFGSDTNQIYMHNLRILF